MSAAPAAVLLDALGTLVALRPPAPALRAALARRGVRVSQSDAAAAMRAEIAHYRAHHDRAATRPALQTLRDECAAIVQERLATGLPGADVRAALLEAIRFDAYPEAAGALGVLRTGGARLAIVSNWDVSLHDVLAQTGLAGRVDAVVTSAQAGVTKPDGGCFRAALEALGVAAADAVHVGDDPEADVAGALGAGLRAVLVDRAGAAPRVPPGVGVLRSLDRLPALLGYA